MTVLHDRANACATIGASATVTRVAVWPYSEGHLRLSSVHTALSMAWGDAKDDRYAHYRHSYRSRYTKVRSTSGLAVQSYRYFTYIANFMTKLPASVV